MHLGIDVGSVAVKVAAVDGDGFITGLYGPVRHMGRPWETLARMLAETAPGGVEGARVTGSGREWVGAALGVEHVNVLRALVNAFARLHPEVRTIAEIGGTDSKLISMESGSHGGPPIAVEASRSSLCAAGTGAFLDQQALRLGYEPEDLGRIAATGKPATVSGRCSVFAKSDLIHLQQMGTLDRDMLAGLCHAVARSFRTGVAKGRAVREPLAFCGGVALNECVRSALAQSFGIDADQMIVPERPECMGAIGAALLAAEEGGDGRAPDLGGDLAERLRERAMQALSASRVQPLSPPSNIASRERPAREIAPGEAGYLGVDIGSISTKAAVVNELGEVMSSRYRWTSGRPLEAVRAVLGEIGRELGGRVRIAGVGVTGSGRYMVGDFLGADVVVNEITAQARAAVAFDPSVDTVIEIGGQDSKFIVIEGGRVVDFEMNKVCAAGTGSFLTEQAERLGMDIERDFASRAFAASAPVDCGERCTVFMDSDVAGLVATGAPTEDICAGLALSIARNYLSRVAERSRIGKKVLFQGAVAFNDAVVAAFERELGRPVRVTPNNEITGCIGVAMIAAERAESESRFRGFDEVSCCEYSQDSFTCRSCENGCEVRTVKVEGMPKRHYGDRCDRYQAVRRSDEGIPDLFAERETALLKNPDGPAPDGPVVGIPRTLSFMEQMPYWRAFFYELGARTVMSAPTSRRHFDLASEIAPTESCLPIKAALGHAMDLVERAPDFLFLPTLVDRPKDRRDPYMRYNCPFVQVWGHVARARMDPRTRGIRVLEPVIFHAMGERLKRRELVKLVRALGAETGALDTALEAAEAAQRDFAGRMIERGRSVLADLQGRRGVVLVGRPYNACDPGMSLNLPKKLRDLGVLPIPMDMLTLDPEAITRRFPNMFWNYGRLMLAAAELVAADERLEMVYVTNFRCGPDSFLMKMMPEAAGKKPYLVLEFDDHSADAGVVTRLEAFLDSRGRPRSAEPRTPTRRRSFAGGPLRVYMPHMGDMMYAAAAACRGAGVDAVVVATDDESLSIGRQHSSGRECLPYVLCVGNIVKTVRSPGFDPEASAFFMTSSGGPCRMGQYEHGMRIVLDELGLERVPIISLNQSREAFSQMPSYKVATRAYFGMIAVCELEHLARQRRPHEVRQGSTDEAYAASLADLCGELEAGRSGRAALARSTERFRRVEIEMQDKPRVLLVGETFVRMQPFANCNIVRKLEALGAEVVTPSFAEWVHHMNLCLKRYTSENRLLGQRVAVGVTSWLTGRIERTVARDLGPAYLEHHDPSIECLWRNAERAGFVPFFGDASLAVGLAVELREGRPRVDGIINVLPFTCMVGSIGTGQIRRAAPLIGKAPFIEIEFDGRSEDMVREELEMFMEQVRQSRARANAAQPAPRQAAPAV